MNKRNDSLLFEGSRWRLHQRIIDPSEAYWLYSPDGGTRWMSPGRDDLTEVHEELARRLLAERAEREKLDEHNDRAEEKSLEDRAIWSVLNRHEVRLDFQQAAHDQFRERVDALEQMVRADLDRRLGRLEELDRNLAREIEQRALETKESRRNCAAYERVLTENLNRMATDLRRLDADVALLRDAAAPPQGTAPLPVPRWDRTQGIMVDGLDRIVLDLSDYFEDGNMSQKDHDLLEKLADLWRAWGEGGYMRDLLAKARYSGDDISGGALGVLDWFRQLRSKLLAKPWKEGCDV